ncbi:MAG: PD-(D/E)XK nuclease family protein [Armatimonadota bacterium]
MKVTVFCSPHWSALQDKALSIWLEAQQSGVPPIMFVPTTAMRTHWLSVIAEATKGVSGDSVSVLDFFAHRLAASCTEELFRLAQPTEQKLAAIIARSSLNLCEEWERTGVIDVFLNSVEELELHGFSPETLQSALPHDETVRVLAQWWQAWKDVLHKQGLWSLGDALKIATDCLQREIATIPKMQTVLIYGFTALTSARWNFLKTLLENMNPDDLTVYFFIPSNPENQRAYGYAQPLINRLRDELRAEVCLLQSSLPEELQLLPTLLFRWHHPKDELKPTDRIVYIATAGEEQEVETAVRLLVHWRRVGKLRGFSDALLIAQSLEPYLPALKAISARYELPFLILDKSVKPHSGLANLISSIWDARRSNWEGEILLRILPSPYLHHPSMPQTPLLPKDKHRDFFTFVRQRLAESGSKRWIELLKAEFVDETFVKSIADFLDAVDELPVNAEVSEHARHWQKVIQFIRPIDEKDERTLQNLRRQLNGLKAWSAEVLGDEFVEILIEGCSEDVKEFSDAVRVASASDARGQVAPVVILLGMSDGRFPPPPPMFEFLTDKHREDLTEKLGLKTSLRFRRRPKSRKFDFVTFFAQEQRMLFAEMIGIATERLVFAHPRTDPDGKPIARSLFLDEVEDSLKAAGYIWQKEERDISDVVLPKQISEQGALPEGVNQAIDAHEAKTSAMFYAFTGHTYLSEVDKGLVSANLRDENLRERLLTEWKRWTDPQEGSWDGRNLKIDRQALFARWKEQKFRVTALEDYGHCPYRFFARHVLGLSLPREMTYFVDPMTFGDLWHKIIAEFLENFRRSGKFPDEQVLQQVAKKVVEEHPQVKQAPQQVKELVWNRIEKRLPFVWRAEEIQAREWTPVRIEEEILLPVTVLGDIPQEWREFQLVMRPDRVDRNIKGELRVVDYKTGSVPIPKSVKNGVAFQLPLYALALQRKGNFVNETLYLKLGSFTKRGSYSTGCHLSEELKRKQAFKLSDAVSAATTYASRYLHKISQSEFTVLPYGFSESCRNCDFKALCRHHPLRLKERETEADYEEEA